MLVVTALTVRMLLAISRSTQSQRAAHPHLAALSGVAIIGGLVQFGAGVWAWRTALAWLDLDPTAGPWETRYQYLPTPDWPLALLVAGLATGALAIALRTSAPAKVESAAHAG